MDFSHSPKVVALQEHVMAFVTEHVIAAETEFDDEMKAMRAAGGPMAGHAGDGTAQDQGQGGRPVEHVPA